MIAVGDQVTFRDSHVSNGRIEPHSGQTATIARTYSASCILKFSDGQEIWAFKDEVTAL